jgi:hypothetical protein
MARPDLPLPQRRNLFETMRRDLWWGPPMFTLLVLLGFIIYSTWAAVQNEHYLYMGDGAGAKAEYYADYLSPFYAPVLLTDAATRDEARERGAAPPDFAWFGVKPEWWPWIIPFSPAFLILWAPGGFRLTCYYYRGAYYKAFWGDPPACAVGEPKFRGTNYRGEQTLPLVLQNIHRYFMYLAVAFIFFLGYEAWRAMWFVHPDDPETRHFGMGVGTLVLIINVVLLAGYTFGCHSFRHVIGGWRDQFSGAPVTKKTWDCVSCLNRKHMQWAWASLIWVAFADVYVRLVSMGVIGDHLERSTRSLSPPQLEE